MKSDFVVEVQYQNPSSEHTLNGLPFVRIHFQVINKKLAMLEGYETWGGGYLFSEGGLVLMYS